MLPLSQGHGSDGFVRRRLVQYLTGTFSRLLCFPSYCVTPFSWVWWLFTVTCLLPQFGPFTPLLQLTRLIIGDKPLNKLRGKGIALHSQVCLSRVSPFVLWLYSRVESSFVTASCVIFASFCGPVPRGSCGLPMSLYLTTPLPPHVHVLLDYARALDATTLYAFVCSSLAGHHGILRLFRHRPQDAPEPHPCCQGERQQAGLLVLRRSLRCASQFSRDVWLHSTPATCHVPRTLSPTCSYFPPSEGVVG